MTTRTPIIRLGLAVALGFGLASCIGTPADGTNNPQPPGTNNPQGTVGDDYGIDHDTALDNIGDVFKDGRQLAPHEGEKLRSCGKLRFDTLKAALKSRGINVDNTANGSAGALLKRAEPVWGLANFPSRVAETTRNSTSGLVGLQDIMIAVGEELVTSANSDGAFASGACQGSKLFDGMSCNKDGFACLIGVTPSQRQLDLCANLISDSGSGVSDALLRKRFAVAALAGVSFLCD